MLASIDRRFPDDSDNAKETDMKTIAKMVLGGLMLAGTAAAAVTEANAGVSIGVNVGGPRVAVAYGYGGACYRPLRFRPAYCGYPVYRERLFVDGAVYRGPVAYRVIGRDRYFWLHNRWERDRVDFHRDHAVFRR